MGNFDERDKRPPQPVVIEDRRHLRDLEEAEAEESAPAPAASIAPGTPPPGAVDSDAAQAAVSGADGFSAESAASADVMQDDGGPMSEQELAAAQQAEMAYMMQIFQLGLPAYLRSQLGILLNFALINLGRAANPATGLVTADLEQAKLAIDSFEFVLARVQAQLEARERIELAQLLSELKFTFMQALGGPSKPAAAPESQ